MKTITLEEDPFSGKRTNRYFNLPVKWDTYPEGVVLASRGTKKNYDNFTDFDCGTITKLFAPVKDGVIKKVKGDQVKKQLKSCDKLDCHCCGLQSASKTAVDSAMHHMAYARTTNYNQIKFISFDMIGSKDAKQGDNESKEHFKERKKKLKKFDLLPGENFRSYKMRIQPIISNIAKETGMKGFSLVMHADRIDDFNGIDVRNWNPHFHLVGCGYILNQNEFFEKYGFGYTQFEPININEIKKKKDKKGQIELEYPMEELTRRIAYIKNHSAFYKTPGCRNSHSIIYYGDLSYRKLEKVDEVKIIEEVKDDDDDPYLAIKIPKKFLHSKVSKYAKFRLNQIRRQILLYKMRGYYEYNSNHFDKRTGNKIYDGKKFDYFPEKLLQEYNQILKENIYNNKFKIKEGWNKFAKIEYTKEGSVIRLVEVEVLQRWYNKVTRKYANVSSNECFGKPANFQEIDDKYSARKAPLEQRINVWKKIIKRKELKGNVRWEDYYNLNEIMNDREAIYD